MTPIDATRANVDPDDDGLYVCPTIGHGYHDNDHPCPDDQLDVDRPAVEVRIFYGVTTGPTGKALSRRSRCQTCNSTGQWQDSLYAAVDEYRKHERHVHGR